MWIPTTKEEAEEMIWLLEKQRDAPDLGQEQVEAINQEIERIRQEWLSQA